MKTKRQSHNLYSDTKLVRNRVICVLSSSIIFTTLLILFSPSDHKVILTDIIEPLAAVVAASFSVLIIYRQKTDGLIGKAHCLLGIGLALFLAAEIIWSYYEIGLQIENPFPSIADALWIIGYLPLSYFVFKMYRFYGASRSRAHRIFLSVTCAIFMSYLISSIYQNADLATQTGTLSFLISICYPMLDILLLVPAALIILNPVKGELTSIPWIFLAIIIMSIGDTAFAYSADIALLQNTSWIWNLFFISSYFVISAGLFWHNRFFIQSNKEIRDSKDEDITTNTHEI